VIATAVGGVVDLLGAPVANALAGESDALKAQDGAAVLCERGMRVAANDEAAFCAGLARLIADEGLRREAGERGRRYVEGQYSKERLLADVKKLYAELAEESKAAAEAERLPEVHKQGERGVVSSEHRI
jgi:glycosyltransferase involved in cell wall biosynthesis